MRDFEGPPSKRRCLSPTDMEVNEPSILLEEPDDCWRLKISEDEEDTVFFACGNCGEVFETADGSHTHSINCQCAMESLHEDPEEYDDFTSKHFTESASESSGPHRCTQGQRETQSAAQQRGAKRKENCKHGCKCTVCGIQLPTQLELRHQEQASIRRDCTCGQLKDESNLSKTPRSEKGVRICTDCEMVIAKELKVNATDSHFECTICGNQSHLLVDFYCHQQIHAAGASTANGVARDDLAL